ncbi:hypothetical protein [Cellulomonas fimi]|uniref:Uncharacterized protein n=1 Tax=Cellulomonas fimi TaxID=1708 RepID=A0A7Y0LWU8_CELFI|nr:hypothetical protein [Cellulomonas fimi]NMR19356.1 hypothetical protein [Cellulomonas fimi]
MMIDCGTCTVRGAACADCVVTFLTIPVRTDVGPPPVVVGTARGLTADVSVPGVTSPGVPAGVPSQPVDLDDAERVAIGVLASSGLVPPLRLAPPVTRAG